MIHPSEYIDPTNPLARKRGRKRSKLTTRDKIQIVHKVLCQHHTVKEVAKEYRISQPYTSLLVTKAKKKPGFLDEIAANDQLELDFREKVAVSVNGYIQENKPLHNVKEIQEKLLEDYDLVVKDTKLRNILHKELRMRYTMISSTSWQGNAPKNLILR